MSDLENFREETRSALVRIQEFDPQTLVQAEKLGSSAFSQVVEPAKDVISLFQQLPAATLDYLPQSQLKAVKDSSNSLYQMFEEILSFDVDQGDVKNRRNNQVANVVGAYEASFRQLHPIISYSVARTVDFNRLEQEGRAAVQGINDQTSALMSDLEEQKKSAESILEEVRQAAAEQGVSQQASYFKDEADHHKAESEFWRTATIVMATCVGFYGVATLFFHKVPFLTPSNTYETIQMTVGKVLIFFVLAYMLSLCAKNFLSNRHNEIVNRHRQNALMTYKALVDATVTPEARDVILNHAASSVYRLHDTGYTKAADSSGSSSSSVVEMLPRTSLPINSTG